MLVRALLGWLGDRRARSVSYTSPLELDDEQCDVLWASIQKHFGEGHFVPRPGADAEDDGVFVQPAVHDDGRTFVAVLDGAGLEEIARAYTPSAACMGFHSTWLPLAD